MTDEQRNKSGQRIVYVDDDRWDKVTRRAFAMTEKGKARVSYSEVVRMALDKFFGGTIDEKIDIDLLLEAVRNVLDERRNADQIDGGFYHALETLEAVVEKLERDRA